MQIILLPGMDGTGILFRPFVQELTKHITEITVEISVRVLSYPCDQKLSYEQLIDFVRSRLPAQEEVILVAESFSGPIGYALAAEQPNKIRAVIFVATFLSPPKGLLCMMPPPFMALLMKIPLPVFFLSRLFFERGSSNTSNKTIALFKTALRKVQRPVLATRMREMADLAGLQAGIEAQELDIPCAYIRAKNDQLISCSHAEEFRRIVPQIEVTEIPGPHFLMQARPKECAQVVGKFITGYGYI
ncbi:MAG: alpha/beta hydrolase [Candidatus Electrothrix sp. AX5]|nr:alpha/beta hydrolase [Candidatus Electrothrix sp. AX5]